MLGVQHLDVPHLRGRKGKGTNGTEQGAREEEGAMKGGAKGKKEAESMKQVSTSEQVGTSAIGGRVKKDRADRKKKAKTQTWSDVVKGLVLEGEPGETDLDKSGNELKTVNSVQELDSEEPYHLKAKKDQANRKEKEVCTQEEKCMLCGGHHDGSDRDEELNEEYDFAELGLLSKHAERGGRGAQN
jgi:hypothetical protein